MNETEQELNKKLAEWRGFYISDYPEPKLEPSEKAWFDPNGMFFSGLKNFIYFPRDLNACFEWLVPELQKSWDLIELIWDAGAWDIHLENYVTAKHFYLGKEVGETFETLAPALCKAIEKLIGDKDV